MKWTRCGVRKTERPLQRQSSTWKTSKSFKVEIEELASLLGPDDTEVDFRRTLEEARDENGCAIFETFSTDGASEFLVVSRSRWDKHQRRLTAPCATTFVCFFRWKTVARGSGRAGSWMELVGQKGHGSSGEIPGNLRLYKKVDNEALERLMEPENEEVSLRYIVRCSTRDGSDIFQLF